MTLAVLRRAVTAAAVGCWQSVREWFEHWCFGPDADNDTYETLLLENTIIKIGGLLQIGFGEAGRDIIRKNMAGGNGVLQPLLRGSRVDAVFGFCDVRQFTDVTECLQVRREEEGCVGNLDNRLLASCLAPPLLLF